MPPTLESNIRSRGHCCSQSWRSPSSCSPITENRPDESAGLRPPRRRFGSDRIKEPPSFRGRPGRPFPRETLPRTPTNRLRTRPEPEKRTLPLSGVLAGVPALSSPHRKAAAVFRSIKTDATSCFSRQRSFPRSGRKPGLPAPMSLTIFFVSDQNPSPKSHRYP